MNLFKRRQAPVPVRRRLEEQISSDMEGAATFRRGRTLTGSASSLVHTPNEMQADLKSSRVHAHVLLKKRRHLGLIFTGVLCAAIALYVLVSEFTARPVVQASPDPSLQLESVYVEAIDGYLSDHLRERWRLFTDTERLTRHVQSAAPEVESIKLGGSAGFGASLFEVTFRQPIASWDVNNRQLFVDENGVPFSRNYYDAPSLTIIDKSGISSSAASQSIMSNRFMSYIGQVIGLSEKQGLRVSSITIPQDMTRQVEVRLEGVPYPFKFSSDRPAGEGVEDMMRAHTWMTARGLTPEYVDVRVSGKVFYR